MPVPGRGGWRWAWAGQPCGGACSPDDEARGASRDTKARAAILISESELKGEVRRVLAGATAAVVMAVTGGVS